MTPRTLLAALAVALLPSPALSQTFSCRDPEVIDGEWSSLTNRARASTDDPLAITSPGASSTITLEKTEASGQLCTLFAIERSDDGAKEFYVPAGRSYDGKNWERVAGKHSGLEYSCSGNYCTVTLPNTDTTEYYMAAASYELTDRQKTARFLEKASFGPQVSDFASAVGAGTKAAFSDWIAAQNGINPSSHREYFRSRLNPRQVETMKYARTGPHPCDENSRWRNFAFTRKDATMSTGSISKYWPMQDFQEEIPDPPLHNATLEKRTYNTVDKWAWVYAGHVRTILDAQPQWSDESDTPDGVVAEGVYDVCDVDEAPGSTYSGAGAEKKRTLYARFKLVEANGNCNNGRHVFGGNPDVEIDVNYIGSSFGDEGNDPYTAVPYILDLTSTKGVAASELLDNEIGYNPDGAGGIGHGADKTKGNSILLLTKANYRSANSAECGAVPDPTLTDFRDTGWRYSPYYDGFEHPEWGPSSRTDMDPPVFAEVAPGVYRIHDKRLTSLKNTIDEPLPDGGGTQTLESIYTAINDDVASDAFLDVVDHDENPRTASRISKSEQAIYCSNADVNPFNEAGCELSTNVNACAREPGTTKEDTVVVTTFESGTATSSLARLNTHITNGAELLATGRPLRVFGLGYAADPADDAYLKRPCEMEATSRWVAVDAAATEAACDQFNTDASITLATATTEAFQHLFKYSVSNNAVTRDLRMHEGLSGMGCDAGDATKAEFHIWDAHASKCWKNAHPDENNVYLVSDTAVLAVYGTDATNGELEWTGSFGGTSVTWRARAGGSYELLGMQGETVELSDVMSDLGIYESEGGKAVTAAPTSQPSMAPTSLPSFSSAPSTSQLPSSAFPSSSTAPSLMPSTSSQPSGSTFPSSQPSSQPSSVPSTSSEPSQAPTIVAPSAGPSTSVEPSSQPSSIPSVENPPPSSQPSQVPTIPASAPSLQPSMEPSQLSQIARTIHDGVFDTIVNDQYIASIVLETQISQKAGGVLVCGSSGEIESVPAEDDYFDYWNRRLDSSENESEQKKTVWTNLALTADDQLCQRTAFALSQIFAISPAFLTYPNLSEAHTNFYDGFVRNCHSSYKALMKVLTFSVKLGMQLSIVGSTSIRFAYDNGGQTLFPDENFARESMQLETVGLDLLNLDGTKITDDLGFVVPTYDTDDILTFARVWTGFEYANRRGNYEEKEPLSRNWNDPMELADGNRHDWFPKMNLYDGWIGDRYPLCHDLPDKAFLKTGAKYVLLGRSSDPRYQFDPENWDGNEKIKKMTLRSNSQLLQKLCGSADPNACSYPSVVVFDSDLACDSGGLECEVDAPRVVQVAPDVFYEYVRRPCVHHAFMEASKAKKVFAGAGPGYSMCAHESQPVGTRTCCPSATSSADSQISCTFHGEKVSYATNTAHCQGAGLSVCPASTNSIADRTQCSEQTRFSQGNPLENHLQWTSGTCSFQVKVRLDGFVAIVHVPESATDVVRYVDNSVGNINFLSVPWPTDDYLGDPLFPTIDNACGEGTCVEQDDWTCLCDVAVAETAAFTSAPLSASAVAEKCKIGAFPPEYLGGYSDGATTNGVTVYHKDGEAAYSIHSIFKIADKTDEFIDMGPAYHGASATDGVVYLKNVESKIQIGDPSAPYYTMEPGRKPLIMRNPVMFHDLADPEIRDAHYEIDALIHHLTSHQNAPPFVALQLIQHFGNANPSPGYIERVATAYKNGKYTVNGNDFGDGTFSSLDAVVAAILLDDEATSGTLDPDPAHGGIKEPILKVLQFMRSQNYAQTAWDRNIYPKLHGMVDKIGQMAHESPDQFSFFLPDYSPPGALAVAQMFGPPAQVLSLSTTVATTEGLFALSRNGLSKQGGGFGQSNFGNSALDAGDISESVGHLSLSPAEGSDTANVELVADLLTGGRLGPAAVSEIATGLGGMSADEKNIFARQAISTAPEFHTTNLAERTIDRQATPVQGRPSTDYKAVIILNMAGGADSFNILSPHTSCGLYRSYRRNRGSLALWDTEMDAIDSNNPDQPCSKFGVNKNIRIFKDIYDAGHGQFHANIGHLAKHVSKRNWRSETKTHLFSHKTMEREAQLVDAFQEDGWSTGVGGRMLDVLQRRGLSVSATGVNNKGPILEGDPSLGRVVEVISASGINLLTRQSLDGNTDNDVESIEPIMSYLNKEVDLKTSGIFSDHWSQNLVDVLNRTDYLSTLLGSVSLNYGFHGNVGKQLAVVAKMIIKNSDREVNRDVFLVTQGGHDGHALSKATLNGLLPDVQRGVSSFYYEMRDRNLLDKVTFVALSEFGRTMTPNTGKGSDHAWGGNAFVFGGQIQAKVMGHYPGSFDNEDETNIGRGRLIPTSSWERMWYGVTNWMGVTNETDIDYVLPNNQNMGCQLYTDQDMYTVGDTTIDGCNDRVISMRLSMLLGTPRYLTGLEQKRICRAAIFLVTQNANATARCVVVDQEVVVNFDENRRRVLSHDEMDGRFLETIENTTLNGLVELEYVNPEGTLDATGYVESDEQFGIDMNDQIAGGSNCNAGTSRRRLSGHCEFGIDNCEELTEFYALVTEAPSLMPSTSESPSAVPSSMPSSQPSFKVSQSPSAVPSSIPSTQPTPEPSAKPSVAPSSRPSMDCPIVIEDCLNGGLWSPYTCDCLCVSPHCPDDEGLCSSRACAADYHDTFLDEQPDPFFEYGTSCTATKELPSSTDAIYSSKEDCCQNEFPDDTSGCILRPSEVPSLSFQATLELVGMTVSPSGSASVASVGVLENSILTIICTNVGITCDDSAKVSVTLLDENTIEFEFNQQAIDKDKLQMIESILSSYLSASSTVDDFTADLMTEILSRNPPQSLQSLTAILYKFKASFISGGGFFYPAWGRLETCLSDGGQEPYMNRDSSSWLYPDLESCCQRYFGWDMVNCILRNAEATLISGEVSVLDPTDSLYFPDWGQTDTCINDGSAPAYMKKAPALWMYESIADCCQAYYGWKEGYASCLASQGGVAPTKSPIAAAWYVDWTAFACVESCPAEESANCGGVHEPWEILHPSKSECCEAHLWWKPCE